MLEVENMPGGYVYFISDGEFIKIGCTTDPQNRLAGIQTGNARLCKILLVIPTETEDDAYNLEKSLHKICKPYKKQGEWFDLLPSSNAILQQDKKMVPYNDALIDAITKEGRPGETIRFSYKGFKAKYGSLIFGGLQPKKSLDSILSIMDSKGIVLRTGLQVRSGDGIQKGFSITMCYEEEMRGCTNEPLVKALIDSANTSEIVRFTYAGFKQEYGETIFGITQPKRALDAVSDVLYSHGYSLLTGIQVKRNGIKGNGFAITPIPHDPNPKNIAKALIIKEAERNGGVIPVKSVNRIAFNNGISQRTLQRAKAELSKEKRIQTYGTGYGRDKRYFVKVRKEN